MDQMMIIENFIRACYNFQDAFKSKKNVDEATRVLKMNSFELQKLVWEMEAEE